MTLPTLQPLELPHRCCSGHQTWWTTSCACSMSCPCSSASVSSRAVGFLPYLYKFILCNLVLLWLWAFFWEFILLYFATGIPFVYRGLPCIYSSAILASASLLSGGDMALLRVIAIAMIVFMISQNFYPHDRVLESQAWKKAVYAGGKLFLFLFILFSSEIPPELRHSWSKWRQTWHSLSKLTWCNFDSYQLLTIKSLWKC